jgi:hypothetical protein
MKFGPAGEIEIAGRRWIGIPVADPKTVSQCVKTWEAACTRMENALAELVLDERGRGHCVGAIVSEVPEGAVLMQLCACHGWVVTVLVAAGEEGEKP